MINYKAVEKPLKAFKGALPFDHCVVDNFFDEEVAENLAAEFLDYESSKWFVYHNKLENKKALKDWNAFPSLTYKAFSELQDTTLTKLLSSSIGVGLFIDPGLHGGGWHIHGQGGNLNPHLDYSIHPKMDLQRKLNIIIYLSKELNSSLHGGHLGLWTQNSKEVIPGDLSAEIEPIFNRAVIFDTTQNSWHGMSKPLIQPSDIYRKSLAIYYLCEPRADAPENLRAIYAARVDQKNDPEIESLIKLRSGIETSIKVYRA